jgi:hypothetical protein
VCRLSSQMEEGRSANGLSILRLRVGDPYAGSGRRKAGVRRNDLGPPSLTFEPWESGAECLVHQPADAPTCCDDATRPLLQPHLRRQLRIQSLQHAIRQKAATIGAIPATDHPIDATVTEGIRICKLSQRRPC